MTYANHKDYKNDFGRKLEILLKNEEITAELHYQFYNNVSAVKSWTEVTNICNHNVGIEYISSFALNGIDKGGIKDINSKMTVMIPHNFWCNEVSGEYIH